MKVYEDLTGKVFGRLTVQRCIDRDGRGDSVWLCLCACGNPHAVGRPFLLRGKSRSCGCLKREKDAVQFRTHGLTESVEYQTWTWMKSRCLNPNNKRYKEYAGRGIRICERWLNSFENFLADMGSRPSSKHSIDRINNDGNYEPGNCRWATTAQQTRNYSRNHLITFEGETLCLGDWASRIGITHSALIQRLKTRTPEAALTGRRTTN